MIGGIAANNASGMCCGTAQNSYHTLAGLRVVLADGTVLDTRDAASRAAFRARDGPTSCASSTRSARATRGDAALAARIRHKFRMKNTTGYSLNALVDFDDPIDILAHLMIGSEGTLGFISEITYATVPDYADKASALILFDDLETACRAVTAARRARRSPRSSSPTARRCARSRASRACRRHRARSARTAPRCWSRRAPRTGRRSPRRSRAIEAALAGIATFGPVRFSTDPAECARSGTSARACSRRSARCAGPARR